MIAHKSPKITLIALVSLESNNVPVTTEIAVKTSVTMDIRNLIFLAGVCLLYHCIMEGIWQRYGFMKMIRGVR
jgi:hypothetical protein